MTVFRKLFFFAQYIGEFQITKFIVSYHVFVFTVVIDFTGEAGNTVPFIHQSFNGFLQKHSALVD